ncbi:hypothetical protein MA16_Dca013534 [Dendrobium catenatum]|uniref:Uncharacterized protein n=1 Tax=Dendrobium catenatum TaxID=906689 RepID=A0A2I0VPQ2_9ASPA|nr:hypothetical protein MA16_Dca013534 [Dendrobium catenatum]
MTMTVNARRPPLAGGLLEERIKLYVHFEEGNNRIQAVLKPVIDENNFSALVELEEVELIQTTNTVIVEEEVDTCDVNKVDSSLPTKKKIPKKLRELAPINSSTRSQRLELEGKEVSASFFYESIIFRNDKMCNPELFYIRRDIMNWLNMLNVSFSIINGEGNACVKDIARFWEHVDFAFVTASPGSVMLFPNFLLVMFNAGFLVVGLLRRILELFLSFLPMVDELPLEADNVQKGYSMDLDSTG